MHSKLIVELVQGIQSLRTFVPAIVISTKATLFVASSLCLDFLKNHEFAHESSSYGIQSVSSPF